MSDSVLPHRWQPTRLPHPWDSPSKNTGVGCHFLLQYMKVKSESEVAQLCPTLHDPMDIRVGHVTVQRRQWHPTPVLLPENPLDGGAWWAVVHGVARVGHA